MSRHYRLPIYLIIASTVVPQFVQEGMLTPLLAVSAADAGASPAFIGLILSSPWAAVLVSVWLVPILTKSLGSAAAMILAALGSAACLVLFPAIAPIPGWLMIGFVLGFFMSVRWIVGEAWLLCVAPEERRGRYVGLQETLIGTIGLAGPMALIATGTEGAFPFLLCAGVLAASAALPWLAQVQGAQIDPASKPTTDRRSIAMPSICLVAAGIAGATETAAHGFLPLIAPESVASYTDPLLMAAVFGLGGTLVQIPLGRALDNVSTESILPLALVVLFGSAIIYPLFQNVLLLIGLTLVMGSASGTFYTCATMYMAEKCAPDDYARGIGWLAVANTVGAIVGPLTMGALMGWTGGSLGYCISMALFAGLGLVSVVTFRGQS